MAGQRKDDLIVPRQQLPPATAPERLGLFPERRRPVYAIGREGHCSALADAGDAQNEIKALGEIVVGTQPPDERKQFDRQRLRRG